MTRSTSYRRFRYVIQGLIVAATVLSAWQGSWDRVVFLIGILLMTGLPILFDAWADVQIPVEFELTVLGFVTASMLLGEIENFYERFWWWDILLHSTSGIIIGVFAYLLVFLLNRSEALELGLSPKFVALFAFSFAVGAAGIWEIVEFTSDNLLGTNMQLNSLNDTMWDIIVATVGAIVTSILGYTYVTDGRGAFVGRSIERFFDENPELADKALE